MKISKHYFASIILIPLLFLFVFVVPNTRAAEMMEIVVTDSGRNLSWSSRLQVGDYFGVLGAEDQPVVGIMSDTAPIQQFLVPMPHNNELRHMSQNQEKVMTTKIAELLKDRVHIAATNGANLFEIRLLQNTPKSGNGKNGWQENSNVNRFARICYCSIGKLVDHLKAADQPFRITAALADSGGRVFAEEMMSWINFQEDFQRIDFVDSTALSQDLRTVINKIGCKRVRIINTNSKAFMPSSIISRNDVAQGLLAECPRLTLYTLHPEMEGNLGSPQATPWLESLAGLRFYNAQIHQNIDGKIVQQTLTRKVVGQEFRGPVTGWDPQSVDLHATESLGQLGIMASVPNQAVVPNYRGSLETGFSLEARTPKNKVPSLFVYTGETGDRADETALVRALAQASTSKDRVLIVSAPTLQQTDNLLNAMLSHHDISKLTLVSSNLTESKLQAEAKRIGANMIVGQTNYIATNLPNRLFLIDHSYYDDTIKYFGHAIKGLEKIVDNYKTIQNSKPKKYFFKIMGGLDHAFNYFRAWEKDRVQFEGRKFDIVQSHQLVEGSKIVHDVLLDFSEHLNKAGKINSKFGAALKVYKHLDIPEALLIAGETIDKSGVDLELMPRIAKWVGKRAAYFGTYAYSITVAKLEPAGAHKAAEIAELATGIGLDVFDDATLSASLMAYGAVVGRAAEVLEDYTTHAMRTATQGNDPPSIEEYVGGRDILKKMGFNNNAIKSANIYRNQLQDIVDAGRVHRMKRASLEMTSSHKISSGSKTIQISNPVASGNIANCEIKFTKAQIGNQGNAIIRGGSPVLERMPNYFQSSGSHIKVSKDPLWLKQEKGTVIRMQPSIPAYRAVFPIMSRYEDAKYGSSLQSSENRGPALYRYLSNKLKPILPEFDNESKKLKPVSLYYWDGGQQGPPPPGGGGSLLAQSNGTRRNVHQRMFPISSNLAQHNFQPYKTAFTDNLKLLPAGIPKVDGVILKEAARIQGDGTSLKAGDLSLVYQDSAGVIDIGKLQRFATAVWGAYLSAEGPGISIEPVKARTYRKHEVRHIGRVRNTELAKVMRETDYLMKQWAVGHHRPAIEGFLTPDDLAAKIGKHVTNRASRFWLMPEGLTFKRSGNMLVLSSGHMTVRTEYLDDNPKVEKNEANELFAKWLTDNYHTVAAHYPIYAQLFEYAKLTSLATYLRENRVPMLWFILANREMILTEHSVDEVDALEASSDHRWYVQIYGGVEMETTEVVRDKKNYQSDMALALAHDWAQAEQGSEADTVSVTFRTNNMDYTSASGQSLSLTDSSASGDVVHTDLALWDEYGQKSHKETWGLVTPSLELIRYYNPDTRSHAEFGPGWHLLVPFKLEFGTTPIGAVPSCVTVKNVLSGMEEQLKLERKARDGGTFYKPIDKDALAEELIRYPDGTWKFLDRLGISMEFDADGDLLELMMRPGRTISFKLDGKKHKKNIPGHIVRYQYGKRALNGGDKKVLSSIEQNGKRAKIIWEEGDRKLRIASLQVRSTAPGTRPIKIAYFYENGRLDTIDNGSQKTKITYEDNNRRVLARVLYEGT